MNIYGENNKKNIKYDEALNNIMKLCNENLKQLVKDKTLNLEEMDNIHI